jgi:endoglucanase
VEYVGVNIAGAEFGKAIPGRAGTDYFYPSATTVGYFAEAGMNTIRLPFRWERLQRSLYAELDAEELARIDTVVGHATERGLDIILDVHNYAAYERRVIGSETVPVDALADLWARLAAHYKDNRKIIFGLMNEPKGLPTETWLAAANAAIGAIRSRGATNLVLVPGNGWTGAHSWLGRSYGTPNGEVMLGIVDPARNYAFEVHQYLDRDFSGTNPQCRSETVGADSLVKFTEWARRHGRRGFLGEFGGGSDATCIAALDRMLSFMQENRDVWLGWTYWAAGAWPASYFTSVQPVNGVAPPQMAVLQAYAGEKGRRSAR